MSFVGNPTAVGASTAHIASRDLFPNLATGTFGYQSLKGAADDVIGVPLKADPQRPFPDIRSDRAYYAHSFAQLIQGTNATTLPTQISLQQILAGNFYVGVLAPIVPLSWATNYKIKYDTLTFLPNLPQVVPEEGRTRIGRWKYDQKEFTVQRYGLGARFTHDFLLNPTGMDRARGVLDQMQLSIEDHLKIGVIHALLHCRDAANAREAESNVVPTLEMQRNNLQRTKDFFGILQFRTDGPTALLNHARNVMNSYGGRYNTAVLHWMQQMYCTNLNPKVTDYSQIGPTAAQNFYHLMGGNETFGEGGPPAYLVEEFAHGRGKAPLDFLMNKIIFGHYAVMFDHIPKGAGNNYEGYNGSMRDIEIMSGDNGGDGRVRISFAEALMATGCWDSETKQLIGPDHPSLKRGGSTTATGGGGGKRCSFWYRDPYTKSDVPITHLGQMPSAHFGPASMRNLALTVLFGLESAIRAEVVRSIAVLNAALNQMASAPYTALNIAWVNAYVRSGGIPQGPANFNSPLPPWGASGKMLRLIRDFALSSTAEQITESRLGADKIRQVANAVEVVQSHLCPRLIAAFGSNNAFFSGPDGDSYDGVFDAFIDNGLGPHLISAYSVLPAAATRIVDLNNPPPIAPAVGAILGERRDAISAVLFDAARRFQDRLTGRLDHADVIKQAYLTNNGADAIPRARPTAVAIEGNRGNQSNVLYDPVQVGGNGSAVLSGWANLKATLPQYAQESLPNDPRTVRVPEIAAGGGAPRQPDGVLICYTTDMAGAANVTYDKLVRVLLNYGTAAPANVEQAARNAAARAVALVLLSQVNILAGKKQDTDRNIETILNLLGITADMLATLTRDAMNATFDQAAFEQRLRSVPPGTFAQAATGGRPPVALTSDDILRIVKKTYQDVYAEASAGYAGYIRHAADADAAANAAAAGAADAAAARAAVYATQGVINPRNYESGIFRLHRSVILSRNFVFNISILPAKGDGDGAPVVSAADLEALKQAIAAGNYGAPQASSSRLLDAPAMRSNGGPVRTDLPFAPIGLPGGMVNVERDVRESENFGLAQRLDYSDLEPVQQPFTAGQVVSRRYMLAPSAPAAPAVAAFAGPIHQNLGPASRIATPSMRRNWELIGANIPEVHLAAIARIYLGTSSSLNNVLGMHNANVIVPFTVLLARPFIRINTLTMFLLWAGRETMMTVFGQPNTTWGDDPGTQSYELTITFKSRTIVTKPENVLQIFNSFICGYEGGMGATFFTPDKLAVYLNRNDMSAPHHSIIPILEPYEEYLSLRPASLISLTGSYADVRHMNKFPDTPALNEAAHYYNIDYARAMWGFGHYSVGVYGDENTQYLYQFVHAMNETSAFFSRVDFTCWKDQSLHAHPRTGEYTIMSPADSIIPNDVIGPGMFTAMRSHFRVFKNFEYQKSGRFTFVNA